MKLENQVCTLEQGAKLSALGIEGKSLFYWAINSYNQVHKAVTMNPDNRDIVYPAFTIAELGLMIDWDHVAISPPYKGDKMWYLHTNNKDFAFENEAQARAGTLIYLLENNLTTTREVNHRLTT